MKQNWNKTLITMALCWGATAQAGLHLPSIHIPGFHSSDSKSNDAAAATKDDGGLTNHIDVIHVKVAKKHLFSSTYGNWGRWSEENPCKTFTGTFEGNTVIFHATAKGGSGKYRHTMVTKFNSSYQLGIKEQAQIQEQKEGQTADFKVTLPSLADDVPFVQQAVMLITEDNKGHSVTSNLVFVVSRPVILAPSQDPKTNEQNCFQRYAPYEAITGVMSNATNNVSTIQIHQGIEKLWTSTKGWQWGVYVQPQAFGISLIAVDYSYFQQTSKTVSETTEVVTHYNFDPGDYMQVYVQPTRYVTMYDANLVDACGGQTLVSGAYAFQWWGFAYQVHPVNPYSKVAPAVDSIGAPMMNTCSATYTEGTDKASSFWRTNSRDQSGPTAGGK